MNFTHQNYIQPKHIMSFQNPYDPMELPDVLISEQHKQRGYWACYADDPQAEQQRRGGEARS